MAGVSLEFTGDGLLRFQETVKTLGTEKKARGAYRKVINAKGAELRREAVKILPKQVGLAPKTIRKALGKSIRASQQNLRYIMTTQGGFISYKYFNAREQGGGVVATPRGQKVFLPRHFILAGRAPNRRTIGLGGHVFRPLGRKWSGPITKEVSDVRIPDEMVTGKMEQAFHKVSRGLDDALAAEITRLTKGAVS